MSHQPMSHHAVPRGLGLLMGLVTAVDFTATLSVLIASQELRGGVDASPEEFIWVLTAYAASGILVIPLIERLARRWHYRDLMLGGLALFILGSAWAGLGDTLGSLIAARVLQGVGAGGLFTMARVYLQVAVPAQARPPHQRGYIIGLLGFVAPMPWLTTVLVQAQGWRAIFLLQAAFALVVMVTLALRLKSEHHTPSSLGKLDWRMVLAFGVGALLLLHGLEDLELGRPDARQLALFGAAMASLAYAVHRLRHQHDPLLDMRVLNGRRYLVGLSFYALYYFINGATAFIYPRLFEAGAGLPMETTGALLSFAAATTVLLLPGYLKIAPHLGDRRRVIAVGFACAALALVWMATSMTTTTPMMALLGPMALKGLFPVLAVIQIAGLTYREVPHEDFAHAYALKNIVRQITNAFAAGFASQAWQRLDAGFHTRLVERIDRFSPQFSQSPFSQGEHGLALLARELERQSAVLVGNALLQDVAILCLLAIPLVLWQRRMV